MILERVEIGRISRYQPTVVDAGAKQRAGLGRTLGENPACRDALTWLLSPELDLTISVQP